MPKALGLVETRVLVAAIEAADAMVKTSNVTLIGKEIVRPALVTIKIVGDVAAVKASVDAGAAAAKKVGVVVSTHVIPQPDDQMELLIPEIQDDDIKKEKYSEAPRRPEEKIQEPAKKPVEKIQVPLKHTVAAPATGTTEFKPEKKTKEEIKASEDEKFVKLDHLERLRMEALGMKSDKQKSKESSEETDLEKMNVHQLRKHARETKGFPIQGREISKANRQELLEYFRKM